MNKSVINKPITVVEKSFGVFIFLFEMPDTLIISRSMAVIIATTQCHETLVSVCKKID